MIESQLIAAVSGFSVSLLVILLDTLAPILDNAVLKALCGYLNFASRYAPVHLWRVRIGKRDILSKHCRTVSLPDDSADGAQEVELR